MKKIAYILSLSIVLSIFASCDRKADFKSEAYLTFNSVSFSASEDVGTLSVVVSAHNCSGPVSATIKATDGTAKLGTNYEIVSPASGVLNFDSENTEQTVKVAYTNLAGEYTGNLKFQLDLASATDGVGVGVLKTADFTIKDLDHPLVHLFGTWEGAAESYFDGTKYTFSIGIEADPDDVNKLIIKNLDPYFADNGFTASKGYNIYEASVDETKSIISIPSLQVTGYVSSSQGPVYICGFTGPDPDSSDAPADIVLNYNETDGTISMPNAMAIRSDTGWWEIYLGDITLSSK